jgi:hypothetical protein
MQNLTGRAFGAWAIGRTTVDVRGSNVDNVNVTVIPGVDVKGRVTVDGKPSSPNLLMSIALEDFSTTGNADRELGSILTQTFRTPPRIEADGTFVFRGVPPGRYRLFAGIGSSHSVQADEDAREQAKSGAVVLPPVPTITLPANAYVADIRQDGVSVYGKRLIVGEQSVSPLEVTVKTDGGSVEGTVVDAGGKQAAARLYVVLIPSINQRQNPELYKVELSDEQGHFRMNVVPPGRYTLFAWLNVQPGAWENAEFLRQYEGRGFSVTVSANSKLTTELEVIH